MGQHAVAHRAGLLLGDSTNEGTFAGGLGESTPKNRDSTKRPRAVGDVRDGIDSSINMPACPRMPARLSSGQVTRRNSWPVMPGRP